MKICFVTGEYPPMQGGVGDYTHDLGRELIAQGITVAVITSTQAETSGRQQGVRRTEGAQSGCDLYPVVQRWNWGMWRTIRSLVRDLEVDILHIQYQAAAYGMHPAVNFLPLRLRLDDWRPKIVVTFHDLRVPYLFPKAGPFRWWVVLALARWSDAVIVTNVEDYALLRDETGERRKPEGRIRLTCFPPIAALFHIPLGTTILPRPPADYNRSRWRTRWNVGPDVVLLSYFGFLNESKGGEELVRALDRLVRRGHDVRLLMVGGEIGSSDPTNVACARRVKSLIQELGLDDRVLWTGFITPAEVSASLLASDICVLPYRDGASFRRTTLLSTLSHGLPIVSTEPRTLLPGLVDGRNIILAPIKNVEALTDCIARLMAQPELRRRLGQGAQELARMFRWERIATETVTVYDKVLSP